MGANIDTIQTRILTEHTERRGLSANTLMTRIGDNLHCTGSNKEIIEVFSEYGVEFILVGGLAVSWYCADRQADDMDLLVNPTIENSGRIARALSRLRYTFTDPQSFCFPGLQVPLKHIHYAELLTPHIDGPNFAALAKQAILGKVLGIPVLVAAAQSLIELKKLAIASDQAMAKKHLQDIECLLPYAA
ncbi:MAG: hypothetical protein EG825_01010 [Rhodocyclaceae bacterium]|nr:hypothetical protein [Rhodocyclaceae bacterium]